MKEKNWQIPYARPEAPEALRELGCPPLLAAVLAERGIRSREEASALLYGGSETLYDPFLMKGIPEGAARLRRAIDNDETVAVFGDYDVDGITAPCLLTHYLRSRSLRCLPYIPDRDGEGYGLNKDAVEALHEQGASLLVTVDCGITAREEAAFAASLGMDVIITDHHECGGAGLPEAVAVIDPKQPDDAYPNPSLAGVGVAMKLACACEGAAEPILVRWSDLVAVGTVADVMPLTGENRYLVRRGLEKLEKDPCPGMAAMLREAGIDEKKISAASVGFGLAPRLNAAGRLGQTEIALRLLLSGDGAEAADCAAELCRLNRQRQSIETEIWQEANDMLAGKTPEEPIVLCSENWHQGVIGIAASRLAEQYSLPAIMICLNGEVGKGSCRSYGGFNLYEALSACSEHLIGFGGHSLAAGLNVHRDKLDDFRAALCAYYREHRPEAQPEVQCELLIADPALLSLENVRSLDLLEPCGSGNPRPTLCLSGAVIESMSAVGGGRHLRLRVRLRGESFDGIFFSHSAQELGLREGAPVDLAFTPQLNEFRGQTSVQLLISAARPHEPAELCSSLLSGDAAVLWAAAPWTPQRSDFVKVWRRAETEDFSVAPDTAGVLAQCPAGMEPERFCLCLAVLREVGLLSGTGALYGAVPAPIEGKADLESTGIMRALRES